MKGSLGTRIAEFHGGNVYAKTKAKHGAAIANKQAVAAAYGSMRSIGEIHAGMRKKQK